MFCLEHTSVVFLEVHHFQIVSKDNCGQIATFIHLSSFDCARKSSSFHHVERMSQRHSKSLARFSPLGKGPSFELIVQGGDFARFLKGA